MLAALLRISNYNLNTVCPRVVNPSTGLGVKGGTIFMSVCLSVRGLSEGCKPEYWFGGAGGPLFYVCMYVCMYVLLSVRQIMGGAASVLRMTVPLSEGCKPEYWFGGAGGHPFYVCMYVCPSVWRPSLVRCRTVPYDRRLARSLSTPLCIILRRGSPMALYTT